MSELTRDELYSGFGAIDMRGDFIGFTFDGIHSSELGIVRVSGGDRYEESLTPSFSSQVKNVPGGDGTYYFGTTYNQKQFAVDIAFDRLTQAQFTRLAQVFGTKKIVPLIFDENPYKFINVKISSEPKFTYICFDEEGERIYKGEGNIQFISYSPFARSRFKYEEDYNITNVPEWASEDLINIDEWIIASGIRPKGSYDDYNPVNGQIELWNGGQLETDFNLYIPFTGNSTIIAAFNIELNNQYLYLKTITKENENDVKIRINTKTNLIEGINAEDKLTGSIYNKYIEKGVFFKIPIGESILHTSAGIPEEEIEYNFLYY